MKNQKTYHFRDNDNLLENIDKGKRSRFIRDALKLKFNIDDIGYQEKQATNQELINHYHKMIEIYEKELDQLQEEVDKTKKYKKKLEEQLNVLEKENQKLKEELETLQETNKDLEIANDKIQAKK